jgi:TolB protein
MRRKPVLIILLALLLGGCGLLTPSQKQVSVGPNHKITYAASSGWAWDIHVMQDDGSGKINLTQVEGISGFQDPVWSPDGTWIAMTGNVKSGKDDIYVIRADGTDLTRLSDLPELDRHPIWSPDNTRIVFTSFQEDRREQIYIVDVDGENLRSLTEEGINAEQPAWSPDGKWIAVSYEYELVLIDPETEELKQLTQLDDGYNKYPAWSPDGTELAIIVGVKDESGSKRPQIFLVQADGSGLRQLTDDPYHHQVPVWSPDGTKIAYKARPTTQDSYSLWVINVDGTERLLQSDMLIFDDPPAWSPDSTRIIFDAAPEGRTDSDVFIINSDGTNLINLTDSEDMEAFPDWRE